MRIQSNPISTVKQSHIRKLLDSEGFQVLIEVLQSRAFEHEVEVANASLTNTSGYELKAKDEAQKAVSTHAAVGLLIEMKNQKDNFKISTATPSENKKTP
jgi:hypothetical protein